MNGDDTSPKPSRQRLRKYQNFTMKNKKITLSTRYFRNLARFVRIQERCKYFSGRN